MTTPIDRGLTAAAAYTPFGGYASLRRFIRRASPEELRTAAFAAVLLAASGGLISVLWLEGYRLPPIWAIFILGAVAALAEREPISIAERTTMSVSLLSMVFAAVVFGPLAGFAVGAISNLWDLRDSRLRWMVYTPISGLTAAVAGFAASPLAQHATDLVAYFVASLVASISFLTVNSLFVFSMAHVRRIKLGGELKATEALFLFVVPIYVPILTAFVYAYHTYSLQLVLILFVPTLAAQRLLHLYQEEKEASRRLGAANERLRKANLSFATALVATLDARDRYTAGHSAAVAVYAEDIAARMGLSEEEQNLVHLCGLVHDIGKIGLPPGLLEKPGALTLEERREMERHSEIGEQILRNVDDYSEIATIVRHHHERIDGTGYPDGLRADEIPLLARIIGVADAYNAMTSDRPYRDALPSRVARLRLAQAVESQFDTSVVAAFEAVLVAEDEAYRTGVADRFEREWETPVEQASPEFAAPVAVSA